MTNPSVDPCTMCGKTLGNHQGMRHPYSPEGVEWGMSVQVNDKPTELPAGMRAISSPFDPILRQALIDKGVITPDDLLNAEAKIKAVTNDFNSAKG